MNLIRWLLGYEHWRQTVVTDDGLCYHQSFWLKRGMAVKNYQIGERLGLGSVIQVNWMKL